MTRPPTRKPSSKAPLQTWKTMGKPPDSQGNNHTLRNGPSRNNGSDNRPLQPYTETIPKDTFKPEDHGSPLNSRRNNPRPGNNSRRNTGVARQRRIILNVR